MMITSQENAVRAWVVAAIAACPDLAPIPLERIVWQGQNFPEQLYPRATLKLVGADTAGADRPTSVDEDTDELITRTEGTSTLSIVIENKVSDTAPSRDQSASSYVRELNARTHSLVAAGMRAANLAVRDSFITPDASIVQAGSQWESRANLDLELAGALLIRESPGIIVTAGITGSTTPPTPSRETTIPAS